LNHLNDQNYSTITLLQFIYLACKQLFIMNFKHETNVLIIYQKDDRI
jgi:hypothetical protein